MSTHRAFPKQKHQAAALAQAAPCPCGSALAYGACCGLWHAGLQESPPRHAPTPEALMRSRYSAYVLHLADYLLATWYPESSPGEIDFPPTKWLGLEVKHSAMTGDAGVVEFVARYRDSTGRAGRLHETSRFVREGVAQAARWRYIDGQFAGDPEESPQVSSQLSPHLPPEEASQEFPPNSSLARR